MRGIWPVKSARQLSDLAKKLPPSTVADPYSVRRAMGMSYVALRSPVQQSLQIVMPDLLQQPVAMPHLYLSRTASQPLGRSAADISISSSANGNQQGNNTSSIAMEIDEGIGAATYSGVDLENELRENLESGQGLQLLQIQTIVIPLLIY